MTRTKIRSASPKKAKTAGAVKRKKAVGRGPVEQPENYGYSIRLMHTGTQVLVASGCRRLTLDDAKTHWSRRSKEKIPNCSIGKLGCNCMVSERRTVHARARKMLVLLPKLKQRARRYGWL